MRQLLIGALALMLVAGLSGFEFVRGSEADEETSSIVGSWRQVRAGTGLVFLYTFSSDGTVIATDASGTTWHGAWQFVRNDLIVATIESVATEGNGQGVSIPILMGDDHNHVDLPPADSLDRIVPELDVATPQAAKATPSAG